MSNGVVPDAVHKVLAERIDAIPELEAILLLRKHRDKTWSAEEAGQQLYLSPPVASHVLNLLTERGFFTRSLQRYQYSPESAELEASVTLLAEVYSRHLIAVTNIVHAKPSSGERLFDPAFRSRPDK